MSQNEQSRKEVSRNKKATIKKSSEELNETLKRLKGQEIRGEKDKESSLREKNRKSVNKLRQTIIREKANKRLDPVDSKKEEVTSDKEVSKDEVSKDNQNILYGLYPDYVYFDIQSETLDEASLKSLKDHIQKDVVQQEKKALIALPSNFKLKKEDQTLLYNFLEEEVKDNFIFVSKSGLQWSGEWKNIAAKDLPATDEEKAIKWVKNTIPKGNVSKTQIGKLAYLHCSGSCEKPFLSLLYDSIAETLKNTPLKGELSISPTPVPLDSFTSWTFLKGGLVIDVSGLLLINQEFCKTLNGVLSKHRLKPDSPGLYFVTYDLFQSWLLKRGLGGANIQGLGNIIRVVPDKKDVSFDDIIKAEVKNIAKACIKETPSNVLLVHQVQGPEKAFDVIQKFYPELVLCDDMVAARQIREELPKKRREKIIHITPATDPGIMILAPSLVTQGYDMKLFADYILARYQNNRGRPNETYTYYFDTLPENFQKVLAFCRMEFSHILNEEQFKILDTLGECETDPNHQGSFIISLLKDNLLNFDINLTFTEQGSVNFFSNYSKIFPKHLAELCNPLRLFTKNEPSPKITEVKLHPITNYNEITIKQDQFLIEVRLEEHQSILTIKTSSDKNLETRCFTLFSLLSVSNIFSQLVNKELLIDLTSLLWENFTESSSDKTQGFLITLICSQNKSELKVLQNNNNRALLHEKLKDEERRIQFAGEIPFHKTTTTKRFFKPVSLFFTSDNQEKDEEEKLWRFSCFDALNLVVSNLVDNKTLGFDFNIKGDCWSATFITDADEENPISSQALNKLKKGTDKVDTLRQGRQITLFKNPAEASDKEEEYVKTDIEQVNESVMLKEVEDAKAKEEAARSARLQEIYAQALVKLNLKGDTEEAEEKDIAQAIQGRPVIKSARATEIEHKVNKMIKYIAMICGIVILIIGGILACYIFGFKSQKPQKPEIPLVITPHIPDYEKAPVSVKIQEKIEIDTNDAKVNKIVKDLCQAIGSGKKPTQQYINNLLRYIYINCKEYNEYGDIYNLTGRLYYYKIYLDRGEQLYKEEWKERWKKEAYKAFSLAREAYQNSLSNKNKALSYISLIIVRWMPEPLIFPHMERQKLLSYANINQCIDDMTQWLDFLERR